MGKAQEAYNATLDANKTEAGILEFMKYDMFKAFVAEKTPFIITACKFKTDGKFGEQYVIDILALTPESPAYRVSFKANSNARNAFFEAVTGEIASRGGEPYPEACRFVLKDVGKALPMKDIEEVGEEAPF